MRKLAILILLAALALPAFAENRDAAKRITVAQLEQALAAARGSSDAQVAQQLSGLELIERLSAARLARLEADLPGPQARHALEVLSDTAVFLDLPAADTPSTPPPNHAQQTAWMALTREYVVKTLTKLPNFFASRETTRFEGTPAQSPVSSGNVAKYGLLHQVGSSSVTVLYRDHQEWVDQD
jgi:type II secretory pathway pseudopilin PulG